MNKRFLTGAAALFAGVALVAIVMWLCLLSDRSMGPTTDQDLINARKVIQGGAEAQLLAVPRPLDPSRPVRIAIGNLGVSDAELNRQVGDLVLAALKDARGLELVERESLDKVLNEVGMSLGGFVRAKDAVRVGKLLRADWLLLGNLSPSIAGKALVVRVVDANTGVLREVTVIEWNDDIPKLARELSDFVRQCRQAANALQSKPRTLLAVGTFGDVGITDRHPDLPVRLRSGLAAALQGNAVTLLEREHIDTLLQAVTLDLAGLTEDAPSNQTMQSAMWLVDGYFQSLETPELEVELSLRVRRIFGTTATTALRAPTEDALVQKVRETVVQTLAKASSSVLVPTRVSEINAQMAAGKELANIHAQVLLTDAQIHWNQIYHRNPHDARNVAEAIRAFQTVLTLDPENRVARMYAAALCYEPIIGRVDEARDYYREIIGAPVRDHWTTNAMYALAGTFFFSNPLEAARWYQEAGEPRKALDARKRASGGGSEMAKIAEAQLFAETHEAEKGAMGKQRSFNAALGMLSFVSSFGTNRAEAASRLNELMPKLTETFPSIAPHLLASAIPFQTDTNAGVVTEFSRSVKNCLEHPESVTNAPFYFESLLQEPYDWTMQYGHYALAVELVEAKRRAAAKGVGSALSDQEKVKQGFAYWAVDRVEEALATFESLKNRPIDMLTSGPWGRDPFLPSKAIVECRADLKRPPVADPLQFDLGAPCLHLHSGAALVGDGRPLTNRSWSQVIYLYDRSSFALDGGELWAARSDMLFRLDLALKTNLVITLPKDRATHISALCAGPGKVWIGTEGDGLIEFDKASQQCRRLTIQNGLLLDEISCLYLLGETLWIGYGSLIAGGGKPVGGLGRIELSNGRLESFTPSLASQGADVALSPQDGPPRSPVLAIAAVNASELWLTAHKKGLQRFRLLEKTWATIPRGLGDPTCLTADAKSLFVGHHIIEGNYDPLAVVSNRTSIRAGVEIRSFPDGTPQGLSLAEGLPAPQVSALAANGADLWIGGRGYVAVADLKKNKVRKVSYVNTESVDRIQIGGGYAWVQFGGHLYRIPLQAVL